MFKWKTVAELWPERRLWGEKTRDVLMRSKEQGVCYGLEIETESDYSMPERALVYDVCEYEYQIRELFL